MSSARTGCIALARSTAPIALLVVAMWLFPLLPGAAGIARAAAAEQPSSSTVRRTPALRRDVLLELRKAQNLAQDGKFDKALRVLDKLGAPLSVRSLNSYELANLHNFYAFIHQSQNHIPQAIDSYEKVLAQANLPLAMETTTRYRLAELYIRQENYPRAALMLQVWFEIAPSKLPEAWVMLAQADYHLQKFGKALASLQTGIQEAEKRRQPAQEAWFLLARAVHHEMGNTARTAEALETLARNWPRKEYFMQLSGVYGELGDKRRQLAVMDAIALGGWLSEPDELLNLAYLYLENGIPYKAARLLDTALAAGQLPQTAANVELLGIAWRRARETARAMPELQRAAALANDGDGWARLASIELDEEQHDRAADAARKSLALGGGRRPDSTRVVLGVALYNLGRSDAARKVFAEAEKDQRSSVIAGQWIKFLDSEEKRAADG